ncbi:MAG: exo-alpha-sialidase [Eubacterium sp.]
MKKVISIVLCIAVMIGAMQSVTNVAFAEEGNSNNKYSSIYQLEEDFLTMGSFSSEDGGIPDSELETVTGTYNCVISSTPLYLPYGSVFDFDYDNSIYQNFSIRIYRCDKNGKNNEEITSSYFKPSNEALGDDGNYSPVSFVCNEENGMWINIRIIPWSREYNKEDVKRFNSYINVYDLTEIYAPVFDNSTITQCWSNTANYEAWPNNSMIYNTSNKLYYAFYSPQSGHMIYDGGIAYRTSADLTEWSDIRVVSPATEEGIVVTGADYCENGDILIYCAEGILSDNSYGFFLRSSDNGESWKREDIVLDNENATDTGVRFQRGEVLSDGRLISSYFYESNSNINKICISDDNGKSWKSADFTSTSVANGEFHFQLLNNGCILCVERTTDGIYATISTDNGKSFTTEKKIPISVGSGLCSKTPTEILYNEKTDDIEIYWIDRYATGGLCCSYSTGKALSDWISGDNEYVGFSTKVAALGVNGNNDQGYPEIFVLEDGTVRCFFYQKAIDGENQTSFYYIDGKIEHYQTYQVQENVIPSTCTTQGECDLVTRCSDCNKEVYREHINLAKAQHNLVNSIMPATTTSNGFTIHSCSDCGYTYISDYTQSIASVALSRTQYTYSGKIFKPVVTVKDSAGKTLKNNVDYSLVYSNNKQVGTVKVKVIFKGAYSGSVTKEFKIVPKSTSVSRVVATKKGFKMVWKKQASETTGYQIRYSTSSAMTNPRAVNIESSSKTNTAVTGLKANKKYYIQIRTYKIVNGKRYCSGWSKAQAVTTK